MVNLRTENRVDVLRQAAVLLDNENQRLHKRVQALLTELAQVKGQTPAELQQELIALQELLAQREHALFGKKSERRGRSCLDSVAIRKLRRSDVAPMQSVIFVRICPNAFTAKAFIFSYFCCSADYSTL